jgi:hypothetical protein
LRVRARICAGHYVIRSFVLINIVGSIFIFDFIRFSAHRAQFQEGIGKSREAPQVGVFHPLQQRVFPVRGSHQRGAIFRPRDFRGIGHADPGGNFVRFPPLF